MEARPNGITQCLSENENGFEQFLILWNARDIHMIHELHIPVHVYGIYMCMIPNTYVSDL